MHWQGEAEMSAQKHETRGGRSAPPYHAGQRGEML